MAVSGTGASASFGGLTTLADGGITLSGGGTVSAPVLADVDGSNLLVAGGVTLALPAVTGYTHTSGNVRNGVTLQASGVGSVLDLRNAVVLTNGSTGPTP